MLRYYTYIVSKPSPEILKELNKLLLVDPRQLGKVYRSKEKGLHTLKEIVDDGAAAGEWAVRNLIICLDALLEGKYPKSIHHARQAYSLSGWFSSNDGVSEELTTYINIFREEMKTIMFSETAKDNQIQEVDQISKDLEQKIDHINGVYVYTFPHYIVHPNDMETNRCWLKIGSTTDNVWKRVKDQTRQTSMPEDPKILRVYTSDKFTPNQIESLFHRILDAALHDRSSAKFSKSGKEWFNTTLEFLDVLADEFGLTMVSPNNDYGSLLA